MQSGGRASRCMHPAWRSHGPAGLLASWIMDQCHRSPRRRFAAPCAARRGGYRRITRPSPSFMARSRALCARWGPEGASSAQRAATFSRVRASLSLEAEL